MRRVWIAIKIGVVLLLPALLAACGGPG